MKKFFGFFRKRKNANLITMLDLLVILVIFMFMRSYFKVFRPTDKSLSKDGVKYSLVLNKYIVKKDEFFILNLILRNNKRKEKTIVLKKENIFNYEIKRDGKLIYKKDLIERAMQKEKQLRLGGNQRLSLSSTWDLTSNFNEDVYSGMYDVFVYSKDLDVSFNLSFKIE